MSTQVHSNCVVDGLCPFCQWSGSVRQSVRLARMYRMRSTVCVHGVPGRGGRFGAGRARSLLADDMATPMIPVQYPYLYVWLFQLFLCVYRAGGVRPSSV